MYDFVIIGGGIIGMSTAMQLIDIYPRNCHLTPALRCWKKSPALPVTRRATTAA
ncbi:hypothetical protein EIMP300_31760 [Escherichia coli]|uniref:Hydroxyglutarate oxidase n=1 Tax=Escherichia coli TaxID=562 RepID=A0A8S0FNL8_ECOLX|nr:hypothetical protein EIMP300_31760 [Escherichia coli]